MEKALKYRDLILLFRDCYARKVSSGLPFGLFDNRKPILFFFTIILFLLGFAKNSNGQTITTGSVSQTTFCAGGSVSVPFTFSGYNGNNSKTFIAHLSDQNGSFTNSVAIGTLSISGKFGSGTISSVIPALSTYSTIYRIRVIESEIIGSSNSNGNLTIINLNTISLSSAVGTNAQSQCINTAITNITYSTTGATGAIFSGLPSGVTGGWASNVVLISGTSSVSGTFNYTVTLTGGCGTVTATGSITVYNNFTTGAIINTGETVCYNGDPGIIGSTTAASGGDNSITYEWRANGTPIASSNSATYDPPTGLTSNITYTRWAKDATCNTTFTQSTGSWVVTVNPLLTANVSTSNSSICAEEDAVFNLSGTNGATVTYNVNGGSNAIVVLASGAAIITIPGVTADQTLTLVSVTNGTCSNTITETATVTVHPLPVIGSFN